MTRVVILGPGDEQVLENTAPELFDLVIQPQLAAEFLADSRHHIAVAIDEELVVGFASGVHYLHPDKPPELWVNEVGVAPGHRKRGLGKRLLHALLEEGRQHGCREAWVLTERDNEGAMRLYRSAGGVQDDGGTVAFEFSFR